jgi:hypothetical protein
MKTLLKQSPLQFKAQLYSGGLIQLIKLITHDSLRWLLIYYLHYLYQRKLSKFFRVAVEQLHGTACSLAMEILTVQSA